MNKEEKLKEFLNHNLTPKQEAFCQNVFAGMSQYQAYLAAGYSGEGLRDTIDHNAYLLANSTQIVTRLAELRKPLQTRARLTLEERLDILAEIAKDTHKSPVTAKEKVLAIAEITKTLGDYAPEKHAFLGDLVIEVVYVDRRKEQLVQPNEAKLASVQPKELPSATEQG